MKLTDVAILIMVQVIFLNMAAPLWGIIADRGCIKRKHILMIGAIGEATAAVWPHELRYTLTCQVLEPKPKCIVKFHLNFLNQHMVLKTAFVAPELSGIKAGTCSSGHTDGLRAELSLHDCVMVAPGFSCSCKHSEELSDLVLLEDIAIYCLTNKDFISWGDMTFPGP